MTFLVANVGPGAISPFDCPTQKTVNTCKTAHSSKNSQTVKICKNCQNCQKLQKCQKLSKAQKMPNYTKLPFLPKSTVFSGDDPRCHQDPSWPGATNGAKVLCVVPASPGGARRPPLAFPGSISVFQPAQGPGPLPSLLQPAQGPRALTSCPASPGMMPCVQGLSGTVSREIHVVFGLGMARKPQDWKGLFQPLQGPRRDPQASPGCPVNSPKPPRTLDPWEGLKSVFMDILCFVYSPLGLHWTFILYIYGKHVLFYESAHFQHRKCSHFGFQNGGLFTSCPPYWYFIFILFYNFYSNLVLGVPIQAC